MDKASSIAAALDVSLGYLLGEDANCKENRASSIPVSVYKIQKFSSYDKKPNLTGETEEDEKILLSMDILGVIDENRPPLAVIMPNDSMKGANMNEQDRIIVNPAEHVNNGDPALVIYSGTPMMRWVCYKANGDIELQAANPNHRTVVVEALQTNESGIITIIGRSILAISQKDLKSAY